MYLLPTSVCGWLWDVPVTFSLIVVLSFCMHALTPWLSQVSTRTFKGCSQSLLVTKIWQSQQLTLSTRILPFSESHCMLSLCSWAVSSKSRRGDFAAARISRTPALQLAATAASTTWGAFAGTNLKSMDVCQSSVSFLTLMAPSLARNWAKALLQASLKRMSIWLWNPSLWTCRAHLEVPCGVYFYNVMCYPQCSTHESLLAAFRFWLCLGFVVMCFYGTLRVVLVWTVILKCSVTSSQPFLSVTSLFCADMFIMFLIGGGTCQTFFRMSLICIHLYAIKGQH